MTRMTATARRRNGSNKRAADENDALIGQRLRARRLEKKVSQAELGTELGVSFQQIQKYEKGVNRIGASRLVEIAEALETTVDYFIGELDTGRAHESKLGEFMATRDGVAIVEAMMKIPHDKKRKIVIDLARRLAEVCEETA
ncbi:helix-turn-helix domain-containing protein [Bradyrhizobium sp. vgs-9]|uniref:helix-turn-helix domain-containing protein n=1 Tax=Bradyrhizobium sp. vgs-9 TaxID=208389 RepID=UPI0035D48004